MLVNSSKIDKNIIRLKHIFLPEDEFLPWKSTNSQPFISIGAKNMKNNCINNDGCCPSILCEN